MTLSSGACLRAAELLLAARRELSPIPALPEDCRPATAAEGYAIQAARRAARGGELAGFKIGATSQAARTLLATDEPFHGCLSADGIHDSPATLSAGDTNFRLIEPEFAFRLGRDLPARKAPYGREELVQAITSLHPAFEVVSSAFGAAWTGAGLAQLIADNGVHECLVLGPAVATDHLVARVFRRRRLLFALLGHPAPYHSPGAERSIHLPARCE